MNINKPSISSLPLPLISMSEATSNSVPNYSDATVKSERPFAWKVASNLFVSFQYAWTGVSYAFKTQRNFRIHAVIGILALGLGVGLQLTRMEIAIIGLTIAGVMATELLNTAIESIVDLTVGQSYHDLAKIAKDCAAGAVLITALAAILVAGVLLLPPLLIVIENWV